MLAESGTKSMLSQSAVSPHSIDNSGMVSTPTRVSVTDHDSHAACGTASRVARAEGRSASRQDAALLGTNGNTVRTKQGQITGLTCKNNQNQGVAKTSKNCSVFSASPREVSRWNLLYYQWDNSNLAAVQRCRRFSVDRESGVTFVRADDHIATQGVQRCGSVWACPVCEAVVRARRATDIDEILVRHINAGGVALFVTLTNRHMDSHDLKDLMDKSYAAFRSISSGQGWSSSQDSRYSKKPLRKRVGCVGTVRAVEVTYGPKNGWHPHMHLIYFLGGIQDPRPRSGPWDNKVKGYFDVPARAMAEFRTRLTERWIKAMSTIDVDLEPTRSHGVKIEVVRTSSDAERVGEYLTKVQSSSWSVGSEISRPDLKKSKKDNLKAMDILWRLARLEGGEDPKDVPGWGSRDQLKAIWREYELATKGRSSLHMGALRSIYLDDDATDDQADREAVDTPDQTGGTLYIDIPDDVYRAISKRRCNVEAREAVALGLEDFLSFLKSVGIDATGVHEISEEQNIAKWAALKDREQPSDDFKANRAEMRRSKKAWHEIQLVQAAELRKRLMHVK